MTFVSGSATGVRQCCNNADQLQLGTAPRSIQRELGLTSGPATSTTRGWIVDLIVGALGGGIVGAIVAVNLVITFGPESGYQSSLADVFDDSTALGVVTLAAWITGPLLGVWLARRLRHRQGNGSGLMA